MRNTVFVLALLFLGILNVHTQDDRRLGIKVGYDRSIMHGQRSYEDLSNFTVTKFGASRHVRITRDFVWEYGLNALFIHYEFEDFNPIFGPPKERYSQNVTALSVYFNMRNYVLNDNFYYGGGLSVDYDFNPIDDVRYIPFNSLGANLALGYDIHLAGDFVMSLSPHFTLRGLFPFAHNEFDHLGGTKAYGLNLEFYYKYF